MKTEQKLKPKKKEHTMEWFSWTSPLGSGLFILALSSSFYIFARSVLTLTMTGKTGEEIEALKKK